MHKGWWVGVVLSVSIALSGCMNAAVSGAQAVYNRHSLQKGMKDQATTFQASRRLERTDQRLFKDANLSITTYNGEVLLLGQVPNADQRLEAEAAVRELPNVNHVYNMVEVASPSSPLTRVSDSWITAKIKARIIANNDIDATQVKVVTENSVVYLMGVLPPEQASTVLDIASNTDGVRKVIKMFSYIKISKTA